MASSYPLGSAAAANPAQLAKLTEADLRWVVCPVCLGSLHLAGEGQLAGEAIRCVGCQRRYPVVDGLPVLLANRALPAE
ncbi:MAG TPA: Trm112 family protein [Granulicella sp.]|jgi:hypothetical protein|nr:Trm112 family protein [Granulicella sp.]